MSSPTPSNDSNALIPAQATNCQRCGQSLQRKVAYRLRGHEGVRDLDLVCALRDRSLVLRSLRVGVVVGTILNGINQGAALFDPGTELVVWKLALTYAVPYAVATYGALANGRLEA